MLPGSVLSSHTGALVIVTVEGGVYLQAIASAILVILERIVTLAKLGSVAALLPLTHSSPAS